jgi:hypothetical protein
MCTSTLATIAYVQEHLPQVHRLFAMHTKPAT